MKRVVTILCLAAFCMVFAGAAMAQTATSGAMTGTVLDPDGKAVVGATVTITNTATSTTLPSVKTGSSGDFAFGSLAPGIYSVQIAAANFKTLNLTNIEVIAGRTYNVSRKLEIGAASAVVNVEAGTIQVIETQNTSVQNTITGRAITNLPFASRSGILIGVLDPGAQTVGGPRNSTFEGLPKGSINITFDGINVQDNLLKSSDGFFAINDPRIDDVQEFGITTNANDPSKAGQGAVQMSYVSKQGGNAFHGGVWEYNRNTIYDANYYYTNLSGLPRQILKLNEFGYKVGGPILKDKLFFFTDFEFFQFPQSVTRTRTLLTGTPGSGTGSANGFFTYASSATVPVGNTWTTCTGTTCTVNLLALASATSAPNTPANVANGTFYPNVINPAVSAILTPVQSSLTAPGVSVNIQPSLWQNSITFNNSTMGVRRYPDLRFDYNMTKHQSLEFDYHYSWFDSAPDLLNSMDATYPVAPFNTNQGSQLSNRNLWVAAWRWSIGSNKSNELRWGLQTAPVNFGIGIQVGTSLYPHINTNLGPNDLYRFGIFGVSQPLLSPGNVQGRNTAVGEIHETFQWTRGTHQFTFGADGSGLFYNDFFTTSASVGFGIVTGGDPADGTAVGTPMFTAANLPGISNTDRGNAEGLYATLVGRVSSFSGNVFWSPKTNGFLTAAPEVDKLRQHEFGFYGNDSWRVRPTFTFNFGLRWEYQGAPYDAFNQYFLMQNPSDVWGISGPGNNFKPGVIGGPQNLFYQNDANKSWYNKYFRALAPSVGFAWQPGMDNRIWKSVFGSAGRTVIRAGYSIAYSREGLNSGVFGIIGSNPGFFGGQSAAGGVQFNPGSITLDNTVGIQSAIQSPTSFVPQFQMNPASASSVNVYNPNLHPPMVQSWQVGIQRELGPDMALEIRYQGNHGVGLWDQFALNETNIFENGFLSEFQNALSNLSICGTGFVPGNTGTGALPSGPCAAAQLAAGVACPFPFVAATCKVTASNFADWGLAGQNTLPILTTSFNPGLTAATILAATAPGSAQQKNAFFRNGTFVNDLNLGIAGSFAGSLSDILATSGGLPFGLNSMVQSGLYPSNFFQVNPFARGGAFVLANGAQSTYNALVIDFRRRLSHGLQFDANYAFARSLTNYNVNSSINFNGFTTLRNQGYDKGPAPFDIRHAIKVQGIWDFPFGEGRKWASSSRIVNTIIGGWSFNSVTRWQTGQPVRITSGLGGTFNGSDPGVNLVGITRSQLQGMLQINKTELAGAVWYVPTSLLDGSLQRANTAIIQPCNVAGTLCSKLFVFGPQFFEADWTLAKTTKITEHVNFEMRMEALNAFNNQNFYWASGPGTSPAAISTQSTRFGQMGSNSTNGAYSDLNTTQFPGGRVVQLVGRINF